MDQVLSAADALSGSVSGSLESDVNTPCTLDFYRSGACAQPAINSTTAGSHFR